MRVLITGATGLIGSQITSLCHEKGIEVNYLSTNKSKLEQKKGYRGFYWNPKKKEINTSCFKGVDVIINLAGATVFKRWSKSYKNEILSSRTETANLLLNSLEKTPNQVKQIVSASAIGIYPSSLEKLYYEDEKNLSSSFLGNVVEKWEATVDKFQKLKIKVSKVRIGLVLAKDGGAFPKLKKAASLNLGMCFGNGKQWQSWIHIRDLARMFLFIAENEKEGVYNGVAPNPVTNETINKKLAKHLKKERWIKCFPAPFLKATMGSMSSLLLESQLVSNDKIENEGFRFKYKNINKAIQNLK